MNDFILATVLIVSVACMYMAQHKSTPKPSRRLYTLLGAIASSMIAVEAANRDQASVVMLFSLAATISVVTLALDYLKPSKPDA